MSCQDRISSLWGPYHRHVVLLAVSRVSAGDALGGDRATVLQRAGVEALAVRTRVNALMMAAGGARPLPRRGGRGMAAPDTSKHHHAQTWGLGVKNSRQH